jgi:hypothetical protein
MISLRIDARSATHDEDRCAPSFQCRRADALRCARSRARMWTAALPSGGSRPALDRSYHPEISQSSIGGTETVAEPHNGVTRCHGLLATGGIVACVGCCVCVCARACSRVRLRLRLRARVRVCPCVLAFVFACAPSVAMFPLVYSCVRARYMCAPHRTTRAMICGQSSKIIVHHPPAPSRPDFRVAGTCCHGRLFARGAAITNPLTYPPWHSTPADLHPLRCPMLQAAP